MKRAVLNALVATTLVFTILITANASPVRPDLVATKKLVDLTAQRLEQTRRDGGTGARSSGLTCDACKIIVDTLDQLFMENKTQDEMVDVITAICIDLKIEDRNVCTLVVKEFQVCDESCIVTADSCTEDKKYSKPKMMGKNIIML